VLLGYAHGDCSIKEIVYGRFSGTLIKANVAVKSCCREDFFLDQADFDMYARIRKLGFLALIISCKLVDQELGQMQYIKVLSRIFHGPLDYEPSWRYYYIVRNVTKLFMEERMDFKTYIHQLTYWSIRVLFADSIKAFLKSFGLGLMHA
jgi:rhamnosyltransferase